MQIERVREYEGNFLSRPETLPLKWNYQQVMTRVHGPVIFTAVVAKAPTGSLPLPPFRLPRVERTNSRAGLAPAGVQRLFRRT
jgi:hypothetical protein